MNKKFLYLGILLLLVLFVVWFLFFRDPSSVNFRATSQKANTEEVEKRISWNQKQLSVNVFSTREDPPGQEIEDDMQVHLVFTSFFSFSVNTTGAKITSMSITNTKFSQGIGKGVFIHPPHKEISPSRSYLFEPGSASFRAADIKDGGKTYTLKVVGTAPTYYDEIWEVGGIPNFALITKNIGTISQQTIFTRDGSFDSGKLLQYLGTKAKDLDGEIILDFAVTFDDGKKYTKRMRGVIEGEKIINEAFYLIEMKEE